MDTKIDCSEIGIFPEHKLSLFCWERFCVSWKGVRWFFFAPVNRESKNQQQPQKEKKSPLQ
jgi:hypothetical protein